jgi:hypothetical protein
MNNVKNVIAIGNDLEWCGSSPKSYCSNLSGGTKENIEKLITIASAQCFWENTL